MVIIVFKWEGTKNWPFKKMRERNEDYIAEDESRLNDENTAETFHDANSEFSSNILDMISGNKKAQKKKEGTNTPNEQIEVSDDLLGNAEWGEEIDLGELNTETLDSSQEQKTENQGTGEIFVPPTQGGNIFIGALRNTMLSGLHCAAGDFSAALNLLVKQIALINPEALRPIISSLYVCNNMTLPTLPQAEPIKYNLRKGGKPLNYISNTYLSNLTKVKLVE